MNNFESDEQRKAVMSKLNGSKKVGSNDIEIEIKVPIDQPQNKMLKSNSMDIWSTFWQDKSLRKEFFDISGTEYMSGNKDRFLTWSEVIGIYDDLQANDSIDEGIAFLNKVKKERTYPNKLSLDEFDDIPWDKAKQFGLNSDANIEKIKEYAKKINGQIYTQVDGDNDRVYSKGLRFANATGMYEVVKLGDNKADNS